uniref:Uncharacterized protein n=1 Tax=Panagrolaimus superbus TaxID=310955 RepID=A0A914XZU8_9BILA
MVILCLRDTVKIVEFFLGDLYVDRYNLMKSNIASLLNLGTTRSVFAEGMTNTNLTTPDEKTTLNNWITNVENNIIQNAAITPAQTKLNKLATELDIFFSQNPAIKKTIIFQTISTWGPICIFQYIMDEQNIDYFWDLSSTPGAVSGCKIYDILLDLTKDNPKVQKRIYLKDIPCSVSFGMVTRIANMIYDIPENQRTYFLSLRLPNGISLNQFIRISLAYYPTTKPIKCERIIQMTANFGYADMSGMYKGNLKSILKSLQQQFTPDKTSEDCVSIASTEMTFYLDLSLTFMTGYGRTTWEPPFGSFLEIIIFNECQLPLLKSKAPAYYS